MRKLTPKGEGDPVKVEIARQESGVSIEENKKPSEEIKRLENLLEEGVCVVVEHHPHTTPKALSVFHKLLAVFDRCIPKNRHPLLSMCE